MKSILSVIIIMIAISLTIWMYVSNREEKTNIASDTAQVNQALDDNQAIAQQNTAEQESLKEHSIKDSTILDLSNQNLDKVPSYVF